MLNDDDDKFNKLKQRLEMSQQSPQSDRHSSDRHSSDRHSSDRRKTASPKKQQKQQQQQQKQQKQQVESDSRSTLSNQSSRSVISVNKTLQNQLLNKNTIKASSISFGSSTKGKKPNVNVGSR